MLALNTSLSRQCIHGLNGCFAFPTFTSDVAVRIVARDRVNIIEMGDTGSLIYGIRPNAPMLCADAEGVFWLGHARDDLKRYLIILPHQFWVQYTELYYHIG